MSTQQQAQPIVQPHIPEGFMQNAAGHLVPADQVREQDLLRDALVNELTPKAIALHTALAEFKTAALQDIDDLVAIAGDRYGVKLGGKKAMSASLHTTAATKSSAHFGRLSLSPKRLKPPKN